MTFQHANTIVFVAMVLFVAGCRSSQPQAGPFQPIVYSSEYSGEIDAANESGSPVRAEEEGSIEEYVELGLERNPRLREMKSRIEAIQHQVPQALALPDPILNSTTHIAPVQTAAGEQRFGLGISQKFVNRDRRTTKALILQEQLKEKHAELAKVENEIAESIRITSWKLIALRKAIEITAEDMKSLAAMTKVVEKQFEVDKKVSQQDVLNIQVEVSLLENQIADLKSQEQRIQAKLARLLHVDSKSELKLTDKLVVSSIQFEREALTGQALANRPELHAQLAAIQRRYTETHLAHLQNKPDFTVGLNWIGTSTSGISPVANGDDAFLLGIGMNLPINKERIDSQVLEKEASKESSEARLQSLRDQVSEEVFETITELESAKQNLDLLQQDIIPKSKRSLKLSQEDYSSGRVDYEQLIANWRKVLKFQIAEANLQSQIHQLIARLSRQVGKVDLLQTSVPDKADSDEADSDSELP